MKYDSIPMKKDHPKLNYCVIWHPEQTKFMNLVSGQQALIPEIAEKYLNTYNFLHDNNLFDNGKN